MTERHVEVIPQWTQGDRMRKAMEHAGIKTEELMAQELEVHRTTISRWLSDATTVRTIYLKQWALRCGVPYEWLRNGNDGMGDSHRYPSDNREFLATA